MRSSDSSWPGGAVNEPDTGELRRPVPAQNVVAEDEDVHLRLRERVDRFRRSHDDRFVLVERRVEEDRDTGQPLELLDEPVIARLDVPLDRLHATGVIDTVYRRELRTLAGPRLIDEDHERRLVLLLEPFAGRLSEDRRRERPESLAMLDPRVEHVLHACRTRVGDDRAVTERARPELHAALEPADDLARSDVSRDRAEELRIVEALC